MADKQTPKVTAAKRATAGQATRRTDANPEVKDASTLAPTQSEEKAKLAKHDEFERKTGVKFEEIDTRPVVDANPGDGKTFAERTSARQPWEDFQEQAQIVEARRAEQVGKDLAADAKKSERDEKNS